jgi:hypothetical protein
MEGQQQIRRFNLSGSSKSSGGYQARVNREKSVDDKVAKGENDASHTLTDPSAKRNSSEFSAGPKLSGKIKDGNDSSDGKYYHIDLEKFDQLLVKLVPFAKQDVNSIPIQTKEMLTAVKQISTNVDNSAAISQIKDMINVRFTCESKDMSANTVEAVMKGCQFASCHGVPNGCGQLCAGSLMGDSNLTGITSCPDAVFTYKNNVLELLNYGSQGNTNCYVYVESNFPGYTQDMLGFLSKSGVKNVRTIYYDGDKCTQMSPDFVSLDTLRKSVDSKRIEGVKNGSAVGNSAGADTNQWWWWLVGIAAVIIVAFCIWGFFYSKKNKTTKSYKETSLRRAENRVDPTGLTASMGNPTGLSPIASPSYTEGFFKTMANSLTPRTM